VKYEDREQSLPNTVIPPLARVEDAATPAANAYFDLTWQESPLLVSEVTPDLAERTMAAMKGAKVGLFLQFLVNGKKMPVIFVFEVSDVKPSHLN
jgi:hypothetical protein